MSTNAVVQRAPDGLAGRLDDRGGMGVSGDPLLPLGLDSHRYRCCGNGVVAPVAEWLGYRLLEALR
jgi:site-specific DNA-cytosine methylase